MSTNATPVERNLRKERVGVVTSDKMNKSVVVLVERRVMHMAHDEKEEAHIGDTVRIMETRPLSKQKRWRVVEIVERAK